MHASGDARSRIAYRVYVLFVVENAFVYKPFGVRSALDSSETRSVLSPRSMPPYRSPGLLAGWSIVVVIYPVNLFSSRLVVFVFLFPS
jgi:hypothetical protein